MRRFAERERERWPCQEGSGGRRSHGRKKLATGYIGGRTHELLLRFWRIEPATQELRQSSANVYFPRKTISAAEPCQAKINLSPQDKKEQLYLLGRFAFGQSVKQPALLLLLCRTGILLRRHRCCLRRGCIAHCLQALPVCFLGTFLIV